MSASVFPFSSLKSVHSKLNLSLGAVIDTNLLVAVSYELHHFNEDVTKFFDELAQLKIPLFSTVTVRTEYLDFTRKLIITEKLMDLLSNQKNYKLSKRVYEILRKHKTWIDQEAVRENIPILNDQRIKETKMTFDPLRHSGQIGWLEFCEGYLSQELLKSWDKIEDQFGVNYLQLRGSENSEKYLNKPIDWKDMYSLIEKTGVSSNDAMILNAFLTSKFYAFFTCDFDVAYSIAAKNDPSKLCFVPDALFSRMKKLKF